jgi:carbonic anhydrase/acetyltransferase-like protein (isoleucine patch superfamily)
MSEKRRRKHRIEKLDAAELGLDPVQLGVHPSAFVAQDGVPIGNVSVGPDSSVSLGVIIRGDVSSVRIGARTNLQDGTIVHADPNHPTTLGDGVSVGHRAVIHGATIEDGYMIGMGAILLSGTHVGAESIVGAGALVTEGQQIPARSLVLGVPGRVARFLDEADLETARAASPHYVT